MEKKLPHSLSDLELISRVAERPDVGAQPGPEENFGFPEGPVGVPAAANLGQVKWPSDADCPDYRYLTDSQTVEEFTLTVDVLERVIEANSFESAKTPDTIALAIRGAKLKNPHRVEEAESIELLDARPNHRDFRCVIGYYFRNRGRITLFSGSTVPCRLAVALRQAGSSRSNMLPTGSYLYTVWRHKGIWPALRLGRYDDATDGEINFDATVVRNSDNFHVDTRDPFSFSTPIDNVHCSYYLSEDERLGARFSSWGCLTVRGRVDEAADEWSRFQEVLDELGLRTPVRLVLLTGKDLSLASIGDDNFNMLRALRVGSHGEDVRRLQLVIGIDANEVDGRFGAVTLDKLTAKERRWNQQNGNGSIATGIYTPDIDRKTGWQVFSDAGA